MITHRFRAIVDMTGKIPIIDGAHDATVNDGGQ